MIKECADPDATVEICKVCKNFVFTCELKTPIDYGYYLDYTCPVHRDGIQVGKIWFCSNKCYYDYFWHKKPKIKINYKSNP